jgi:hypothetical protein
MKKKQKKTQVSQPSFDRTSGDYEIVLAKPIISQENGDGLQLHGVLALSVDVDYILRELKSLNSSSFNSGTESRHYHF